MGLEPVINTHSEHTHILEVNELGHYLLLPSFIPSTNISTETLNSRRVLFYVIGMTGSCKKTVPDLVGFIVQRARQNQMNNHTKMEYAVLSAIINGCLERPPRRGYQSRWLRKN